MIPPYIKKYMISALESGPSILEIVLNDVPQDSPLWDQRFDPERFTLREMIAHLADWEPVCRARIARTRDEFQPFLPNWDEDQSAIDGDYANTEVSRSWKTYLTERVKLVELVSSLNDSDWERAAERENVGLMTIEQQIMLIGAHDSYHLRQAAEYLGLLPKNYPFDSTEDEG